MEARIKIDAVAGDIVSVVRSKYLYAEIIAEDPTSACTEAERFCEKLGLVYGKIEVTAEARRLNPGRLANLQSVPKPSRKTVRKQAEALRQKLAARGAA